MTKDDTTRLFLLGYPDRAAAEAAASALRRMTDERWIEVRDHAIVSKAVGGEVTVTESRDADPGAQRGALAGAAGAALIAIMATPIGAGAVAVGAGIGAVTGALADSGFKRDDLADVGRLMQDGRALLLVAVKPEDVERLGDALASDPDLAAADRRWEGEVSGSSRNVLRDALTAYKEDPARADD
jgi:uncharacterized membrane protein